MKRPYESRANCGFCKFYGQVFTDFSQDICMKCHVKNISETLDIYLEYVLATATQRNANSENVLCEDEHFPHQEM